MKQSLAIAALTDQTIRISLSRSPDKETPALFEAFLYVPSLLHACPESRILVPKIKYSSLFPGDIKPAGYLAVMGRLFWGRRRRRKLFVRWERDQLAFRDICGFRKIVRRLDRGVSRRG